MEIITALGPLWKFTHGHQDAHELLHIMLSALQVEAQPISRVNITKTTYKSIIRKIVLIVYIFNFSDRLLVRCAANRLNGRGD